MFLMFSFDSLVNGIVDCYFAVAMVVDYKIANDIKITCKSKNEKFEKKKLDCEILFAMSRYAASTAAPYPLGFIHLELDG